MENQGLENQLPYRQDHEYEFLFQRDVLELVQLFDEPEKTPEGRQNHKDKKHLLEQLPRDLVQQLYGHLMNQILRNCKQFNDYNLLRSQRGDSIIERREYTLAELIVDEQNGNGHYHQGIPSAIVQGEFFELLVEIQAREYLKESDNPENKEGLDKMSETLLAVAHNPDVFGLEEYDKLRNPDLAWLQVDDEGNLVVTACVEAKSSLHLNSQAYQQLRPEGFRTTLRQLANDINKLEKPDSHGLTGFGITGKKILIHDEIVQYIVVCKGTKPTTNQEAEKMVKPTNFDKKPLSEDEQTDFVRLLTNDPQVILIESPFSHNEIKRMAVFLTNKILSQINQANTVKT